jgi:hypothetical protein
MTSPDSILNHLATPDEVRALIREGAPLCLAGSAEALGTLPAGNWIGGTIPYFMGERGGVKSLDRIFVTRFPADWRVTFAAYSAEETAGLVTHTPDDGFTLAISPCGCAALERFALTGREVEGAFLKPVIGWVAGVDLDALGSQRPQVFLGSDPRPRADGFVAAHVTLPAGRLASLSIVNIFEPDDGDVIRFSTLGTTAAQCLVNGEPRALADYLRGRGDADGRLPLVGDFSGAHINVSIQSIAPDGTVTFYAPVFPDTDYHMARPVADYAEAFASQLAAEGDADAPAFACNCILNYMHGGLEGRSLGPIQGPVTFGEIAYQLLNQTLVRLHIH